MGSSISPVSRPRAGIAWRSEGASNPIERETPVETAVGLSFDGRPHTVLMATPADLEDLALGFTVTEAIAPFEGIEGVGLAAHRDGVLADVRLGSGARRRRARPRNLEGRSSCGLCGVQRLADAVRPLPACPAGVEVSGHAIQRALAGLDDRQPLGRATRATHAAAFAAADGTLLLVREDVGRHNALDKLAGALMRAGVDIAAGFVVVTSRCSFEMVEKTARMGAAMLVAVSAPTDLAVRKAEECGLTLVGLGRPDGHTVFAGGQRLSYPGAAAA